MNATLRINIFFSLILAMPELHIHDVHVSLTLSLRCLIYFQLLQSSHTIVSLVTRWDIIWDHTTLQGYDPGRDIVRGFLWVGNIPPLLPSTLVVHTRSPYLLCRLHCQWWMNSPHSCILGSPQFPGIPPTLLPWAHTVHIVYRYPQSQARITFPNLS